MKTHTVYIREATKKGYAEAQIGDSINFSVPGSKTRRGRVGKGIAQTLDTACNQAVLTKDFKIRRLTPKECWRLPRYRVPKKSEVNKKQLQNQLLLYILELLYVYI